MAGTTLSWCAQEVRRHDPDRFLVSLFLPAERREAVFALTAFNNELVRAQEAASEPMLGAIRLQWWREGVAGIAAGEVRAHPVLAALAAPVRSGDIVPSALLELVDARECDLDDSPIRDLAALQHYAASTGGRLATVMATMIGVDDDAGRSIAGDAGTAYALAGLMTSIPAFAGQDRILLPADRLAAHGIRAADVKAGMSGRKLAPVVADIARLIVDHRRRIRSGARLLPPRARGILLFGTLAGIHLARLLRVGGDPWRLPPRQAPPALRLWVAAITGRY
ncbi:MAG: squalene/phytoene synthase family protein [Alphaproteobacteria bacterium]|nr:squalene/phytoene synthase family protein [Alphaproteobacteria bacterium]